MVRWLACQGLSPFTTSTPVGSTPTLTDAPGVNALACGLAIWALITEPSAMVQNTREIGPRKATAWPIRPLLKVSTGRVGLLILVAAIVFSAGERLSRDARLPMDLEPSFAQASTPIPVAAVRPAPVEASSPEPRPVRVRPKPPEPVVEPSPLFVRQKPVKPAASLTSAELDQLLGDAALAA